MDHSVETIERAATDYVALTAGLVSAYVSNNRVQPSEIGALIDSMHTALTGLAQGAAAEALATQKPTPAQIRKSITADTLISFIDGKPYKTLKRHLTGNGITVEQYCERYGLPRDYPTTAATYSAQRSEMARSLGLGNKRQKAVPPAAEVAETISEKPKRAGQPRKTKDAAEA